MRDHPQTMAMQQLQGSGRDVPTEVNLRRAAKIITSDLLRRLRNTELIDDPARLEAADRIKALETALRENLDIIDMFIKQTVGGQPAIDAIARLRAAIAPEQDK